LYPVLFPPKSFDIAQEEVAKLLKLMEFKGRSVLDLCCGSGRHTIALAQRGFSVTGVDRSAFFLTQAKARAHAQQVEVEWVEADMRQFVRPDAFDLVLNMHTSFGYFEHQTEDLQVLGQIYRSLRPGGVCFIEMVGKEVIAKRFQATLSQELPDGSLLVQRPEIIEDWSRVRTEWILVKEGKAEVFRFQHTLYSAQELKDRFHQNGFERVRVWEDLDGNAYGINATRLVVAAWK
jgi:ubiquinone/menaquinone biosynthesis C-methylase UbiE